MKKNLFLIKLTYIKDLEVIDELMKQHVIFLKKYYKLNNFIFSGRQVPRKGGFILCSAKDADAVTKIMKEDPFTLQLAAECEITEFKASMCSESFKKVLEGI